MVRCRKTDLRISAFRCVRRRKPIIPVVCTAARATLCDDPLGAINLGQRGYGRVGHSHLQGARKGETDHDDGAGQHADRDQSAFTVASHNKRAHPLVERRAPRQRKNLLDRPGGLQRARQTPA
jgi:hypothetical protein